MGHTVSHMQFYTLYLHMSNYALLMAIRVIAVYVMKIQKRPRPNIELNSTKNGIQVAGVP
jgi:hypothetical protein